MRREKGPGTRRRILRVAEELFTTQGYESTSVRQIGARSRVTDAAIYHHFPSKQALFDAVLAGGPGAEHWDSFSSLDELVDGLLARRRVWHPNPGALPIIVALAFDGPRPAVEMYLIASRAYVDGVGGVLERLGIPHPALRAELILHMISASALDSALRFGTDYAELAFSPSHEGRLRRLILLYLDPGAALRMEEPKAAALGEGLDAALGPSTSTAERARPDLPAEGGRREAILDAAVGVLVERGSDQATMRRVAAAVGVSDAAIYHYFPSKQALLETVLLERCVPPSPADEPPPRGPLSQRRLAAIVEAFVGAPAEQILVFRLLSREARTNPLARRLRASRWDTARGYIEGSFDERFSPDQADLLADSVVRLVYGLTLRAQMRGEDGLSGPVDDPRYLAHVRQLLEVAAPLDQILASRGQAGEPPKP